MSYIKNITLLILALWSFYPKAIIAENIVLTTGEFPPFNSRSLKYYGLVPRIVTEAFLLEDVQVSYTFYPWKRAYLLSANGSVNGTTQWLYSKVRDKDHYYSDPLMEEQFVWFHLKSYRFDWNDLKSLQGVKVGAIRGYTYTPEFYEAIENKQIEVIFVTKLQQAIDMLLAGRIQVFPENIDVGYYEIRRLHPEMSTDLITNHDKPLVSATSHLLLSRKKKDSPMLLQKFNSGLLRLKESGLFEQYLLESRRGILDNK